MNTTDEKKIDLVCGMEVSPSVEHSSTYKNETYYFCSAGCKEHFDKNPEQYVGA